MLPAQVGQALHLRGQTAHAAVALMDRVTMAGARIPPNFAPLFACACLRLASVCEGAPVPAPLSIATLVNFPGDPVFVLCCINQSYNEGPRCPVHSSSQHRLHRVSFALQSCDPPEDHVALMLGSAYPTTCLHDLSVALAVGRFANICVAVSPSFLNSSHRVQLLNMWCSCRVCLGAIGMEYSSRAA